MNTTRRGFFAVLGGMFALPLFGRKRPEFEIWDDETNYRGTIGAEYGEATICYWIGPDDVYVTDGRECRPLGEFLSRERA